MSNINKQSSFCKNCENFMDITNNISTVEQEHDINLIGGIGESINKSLDNLAGIHIESSDYDVSMSESVGGASISDENVNDILSGSDIELNIKNFNINDLNKNPVFNKLSNNQKTLVVNRILEKIPKNKSIKHQDSVVNKESYFYCKSCGYNEKIPGGQFIFSRGDEKKDDLYNYRFINYVHDNTLPRTKKYNCINKDCSTHQNPALKMAVFYRQKGTYNVRYICSICNNFWDTFVEK
jgi:hypothetical protein